MTAMDIVKEKNQTQLKLGAAHLNRLNVMLERLQRLPGTEASYSEVEVYFYELLQSMKMYTSENGFNLYMNELEAVRKKEYENCRDRFVSISIRNKAVRLFKNKMQHLIAAWLEA